MRCLRARQGEERGGRRALTPPPPAPFTPHTTEVSPLSKALSFSLPGVTEAPGLLLAWPMPVDPPGCLGRSSSERPFLVGSGNYGLSVPHYSI